MTKDQLNKIDDKAEEHIKQYCKDNPNAEDLAVACGVVAAVLLEIELIKIYNLFSKIFEESCEPTTQPPASRPR
jgi:hypothetical protein